MKYVMMKTACRTAADHLFVQAVNNPTLLSIFRQPTPHPLSFRILSHASGCRMTIFRPPLCLRQELRGEAHIFDGAPVVSVGDMERTVAAPDD